jgi:large subunit ribosomal protein L30
VAEEPQKPAKAKRAAKTKAAGKVQVTLRRSVIGEKPKTRQTVAGLGLGKMNSTVELPDNPSVRGMIHAVRHLVEVSGEGAHERGSRRTTEEGRRQRRRAN